MLISNQGRNYPCHIGKITCICEQEASLILLVIWAPSRAPLLQSRERNHLKCFIIRNRKIKLFSVSIAARMGLKTKSPSSLLCHLHPYSPIAICQRVRNVFFYTWIKLLFKNNQWVVFCKWNSYVSRPLTVVKFTSNFIGVIKDFIVVSGLHITCLC